MIELELITLTNGVFSSRKTTVYDDPEKAKKTFNATVSKFTSALVILRTLRGKFWCLDKIERV